MKAKQRTLGALLFLILLAGGVFALLPKAERRSEEFMGAALLLWLDKYTEAEFAEKIGSMSYTEGCVTSASDPANEKETTT